MKALIQRVRSASVIADGVQAGGIQNGLLILLGVAAGDSEEDALLLADKISRLRVFSDADGKMNLSLLDTGGSALVVSNFTLCGDYRKGNRPDFFGAEKPERAKERYEAFSRCLRGKSIPVETGVFGADMQIETCCDGPVTLLLESEILRKKR